jgi:hypothetical protein
MDVITTLTSREFNQGPSRAKKAAEKGRVNITDRGRHSRVLVSIKFWHRVLGKRRTLADALSMPGLADIELNIEPSRKLPRAADFS